MLPRIFLKSETLFKTYVIVRNLIASKQIQVNRLISTKYLKGTEDFVKVYDAYSSKLNKKELTHEYINSPVLGCYILKDVVVNSTNHLFQYKTTWYCHEMPNFEIADLSCTRNNLIWNNSTHLITYDLDMKEIDYGIFLGGHWNTNWFHWSWEIVAKIILLKRSDIPYGRYKLCIPSNVMSNRNMLDLLRWIQRDLKIEPLNEKLNYKIQNSIILDSPLFGRPAFILKNQWKDGVSWYMHPKAIVDYRSELFGKKFSIKSTNLPKRIFLGRKQSTRNYNEDEVFSFFDKKGFRKVFCEELTLWQQMELFFQAEMIVGPSGASWSNLLFANSVCVGFCWAPSTSRRDPLYTFLGLALGIHVKTGFFETDLDWLSFRKRGEYRLTEDFLATETEFLFNKSK